MPHNSQFDPEVTLPGLQFHPDGEPQGITVGGPLELEEDESADAEVHVLAIVVQSNGGKTVMGQGSKIISASKAKKLAAEHAARKVAADKPANGQAARWEVPIKGQFIKGTATGTAFTVQVTSDPAGFNTYTWTEQISFTNAQAAAAD
jgi:hypothetical protein